MLQNCERVHRAGEEVPTPTASIGVDGFFASLVAAICAFYYRSKKMYVIHSHTPFITHFILYLFLPKSCECIDSELMCAQPGLPKADMGWVGFAWDEG